MRFNKLDMNLLVALDVLLTEVSITRAAARLNLSVSATSHALGRLREYFKDDLLRQVGRKMELTRMAQDLQAPIRDILERVDIAMSIVKPFDPSISDRTMRVLASDYTQYVICPYLMAAAAEQRSQVQIQFHPQTGASINELERGECDLLILPAGFGSAFHPEELLWQDELACMVWEGSEHAHAELTLERYTSAQHVVMQPPGVRVPSLEAILAGQRGINRRVAATTYNFTPLAALVVGTDHIATLFRRMAEQMTKAFPVVLKPSPLALPRSKQVMQWHKHRAGDPGLIWLRNLFTEAVTRMERATGAPTAGAA
jgi:DNA-binding transcriptional LysR family regulator